MKTTNVFCTLAEITRQQMLLASPLSFLKAQNTLHTYQEKCNGNKCIECNKKNEKPTEKINYIELARQKKIKAVLTF